LPDDLKAIIDNNSGLAASGMAGAAMDKGDVIGAGVVAASDNTVVTFSDADVAVALVL